MKKVLFLAAVVFLGLGFSFQAQAQSSGWNAEITSTQITAYTNNCTVGQSCKLSGGGSGTCQENTDATAISYGYTKVCVLNGYDSSGSPITGASASSCSTPNDVGNTCTKNGTTGECVEGGDGTISCFIASSAITAGGDNCSGTCESSLCSAVGKVPTTDPDEYCSSSKTCCQVATAGADNCSGTCESSLCSTVGKVPTTDPDEYCSFSKTCCKAPAAAAPSGASSTPSSTPSPYQPDDILPGGAWDPQSAGKFGLPTGTIGGIIESIVGWILGIFGFLGIITFVIAGIFYFTAAGDSGQEETAKNAMKMGIIGIVVGLIGFVIIQAVDVMLNAGTGF